jgi:hypothetical protein
VCQQGDGFHCIGQQAADIPSSNNRFIERLVIPKSAQEFLGMEDDDDFEMRLARTASLEVRAIPTALGNRWVLGYRSSITKLILWVLYNGWSITQGCQRLIEM